MLKEFDMHIINDKMPSNKNFLSVNMNSQSMDYLSVHSDQNTEVNC